MNFPAPPPNMFDAATLPESAVDHAALEAAFMAVFEAGFALSEAATAGEAAELRAKVNAALRVYIDLGGCHLYMLRRGAELAEKRRAERAAAKALR